MNEFDRLRCFLKSIGDWVCNLTNRSLHLATVQYEANDQGKSKILFEFHKFGYKISDFKKKKMIFFLRMKLPIEREEIN